MPSLVNVPLPTLVGYTNVRRYTGGVPDADPPFSLAVLTDGDTNSGAILGLSPANAPMTTGVMETENGAPTLASGQAIDYVTAAVGAAAGTGSAFTIEAVSGANRALMWSQASPNVAVLAVPPGQALGTDWRSYIAGLHTWFEAWNPAPSGWPAAVSQFHYIAQTYARPSIHTLTLSVIAGLSVQGVGWTFVGDGLPQYAYRIKLYTAAQYGAGGFDPDVTVPTIDTGVVVSTNQFHQLSGLVPGTDYRAYIQVAQRLPQSRFIHWSTDGTSLTALGAAVYAGLTYDPDPPIAPINIGPNGTVETTDRPVLTANFTGLIEGMPLRVEWQLATNAGFSANVHNVFEASTVYAMASPRSVQVPASDELTQGTWYLRARAFNSVGQVSSWSSAVTFTITHPPAAVPVTPKSNQSAYFDDTTFQWTFTDPSPYDAQTAYQVVIENAGTGVSLYDSGKIASTNNFHAQDIATFHCNILLRWKVRVWDSDDVVGAYSGYEQFYARYPADIEMTAPAFAMYPPHSTAVVTEPAGTFNWSFTPNYVGQVQGSFHLVVYEIVTYPTDMSEIVYDSGWVQSSDTSHKLTAPVLENNKEYLVNVWVRDQDGINAWRIVGSTLSGSWAWGTFTTEWIAPPAPEPTVDGSTFDTLGGVTIAWEQNRDPAFHSYKVYKRLIGGEWEVVAETTDAGVSTYELIDYFTRAGVAQEYAVSQVADRFGTLIESELSAVTVPVNPEGSHYWLLVPSNPTLNVRLSSVNSDSFTHEYEEAVIQLLGRGRRQERGTHWGINGTLAGRVYGTEAMTARQHRLALEALQDGTLDVWLRNPFGDLWRVAIQQLQIDRMAGVGVNEYFDLSLNYLEVT